jgi:uncharacterized protein with von Willebrand factor type A (vWA) domain
MSKKNNAIAFTGFDKIQFESVKESSKISSLCEKNETLTQDVFNSFFKMSPELVENTTNSSMMSQLISSKDYKALHTSTRMDDVASAFGTTKFAPNFIEQQKEAEKKAEQAKKTGKKSDGTPVSGDGLEDLLTEEEMSHVRQAIRKGVEAAQQAADDWGQAVSTWGINKGELQNLPFEEKFKLAEQLTAANQLKRISDLAGKMKNIVNTEVSTSYTHGQDEIVDIITGNDIRRLLPTELFKMKMNPTQFALDYSNRALLQYDLKGVEELGKGPIVACLDVSGSMAGSPEVWAKAVILSLMGLAEKQKRDFGFVAFESYVTDKKLFKKESPATIQDKVAIASTSSNGGGTNFYAPLTEAFQMMTEKGTKEVLKPADIIFITDGEARLSDEQLEQILLYKKQTGARIYSIAIQCYSVKTLELFSDHIAQVDAEGNMGTVKDLVGKTARVA